MRKLVLVLFLLSLFSPIAMAWDRTFTVVVDASTYAVVGSALETVNFDLDIASTPRGAKVRISRLVISQTAKNIQQKVTFYDNANSTNTITKLWEVELSSESYAYQDFTEKTPLIAEYGLVIRKSSVNSDVTVSVLYW